MSLNKPHPLAGWLTSDHVEAIRTRIPAARDITVDEDFVGGHATLRIHDGEHQAEEALNPSADDWAAEFQRAIEAIAGELEEAGAG